MKPTYSIPSYEGLYFYETDADLNPTAKGYVERLLPNGKYIVSLVGCAPNSKNKFLYRDFNLEKEYLGRCRLFTDEADRDDSIEDLREQIAEVRAINKQMAKELKAAKKKRGKK